MSAAPTPSLVIEGIFLHAATADALAAASYGFLVQLERLGLQDAVETGELAAGERPGVVRRFRLWAGLAATWAPGLDTLGLAERLQLDTREQHGGPGARNPAVPCC